MTPNPYCARPETTLRELTRRLVEHRATAAPVVNEQDELVGLVALADVAVDAVTHDNAAERRVGDIMQRRVFTIDYSATLHSAVAELMERRVHRLVVTEHDRVVGVVSCLDLLQSVLEQVGYPPVL